METMTKEEMRIAIAEKCGWTAITSDMVGNTPNGRSNADHRVIPNYPEDLNACHEMEKVLDQYYQLHYCAELWKVCNGTLPSFGNTLYLMGYIHASALQRCEAFCRVFWPERFSL